MRSTVKELAERIILAKQPDGLGRTIFFIGAGCSVSAGIPTAPEIAKRMVVEIASKFGDCDKQAGAEACYNVLIDKGRLDLLQANPKKRDSTRAINWHSVYDQCFEKFYRSPDQIRELFGGVIADSEGAINWAHLCLGELVAQRLVSTVLTTNFDQLALAGIANAGVLPVVSDGLESLNRLSSNPAHPQLVEIHGSRHTYRLRNRPGEVADVSAQHAAISSIISLFSFANTFVVVGYGGREEGVMDLLVAAARTYPDKNLFWVTYEESERALSSRAQIFLSQSTNSGLIAGQDADAFFLALCQELGVGPPSCIRRPLASHSRVLESLSRSSISAPDIEQELRSATRRSQYLTQHLERFTETPSADNSADEIRRLRLAGQFEEAHRLGSSSVEAVGGPNHADSALLRESIIAGVSWANELANVSAQDALGIYHSCLENAEILAKAHNNITNQELFSGALTAIGDLEKILGNITAAKSHYEKAISLDEEMANAYPADPERQRYLSISYSSLAGALEDFGEFDEARSYHERVRRIQESMLQSDPGSLDILQGLSATYDKFGDWHLKVGDRVEAGRLFNLALETDKKRVELAPDDRNAGRDLIVSKAKVARLKLSDNDFENAGPIFLACLEANRSCARQSPQDSAVARDLAMALNDIAEFHRRKDELPEAIKYLREASDIFRANSEKNRTSIAAKRDLSVSLFRIAAVLTDQNQLSDALLLLEQSIDLDRLISFDPRYVTHQRDLSISLVRAADLHLRLRNAADAKRLASEALDISRQLIAANSRNFEAKQDLVGINDTIASAEVLAGNFGTALQYNRDATELNDELIQDSINLQSALERQKLLAERAEMIQNLIEAQATGGLVTAPASKSRPAKSAKQRGVESNPRKPKTTSRRQRK